MVFLLAVSAPAQNQQFHHDANGNLLSQTAAVEGPPHILGQPQNRLVASGDTAAFSVVVADPRGITYQWRFNGANVPNGNDASLLRENVNATHEGAYDVVLTNPSGSVTSAPAMLWIDNDADGMADSWELAQFGSLVQGPHTDFEGDGSSNLQEFQNDTDPTNAGSVRFQLTVVRDGGSVIRSPDKPSYAPGETVTLTAAASAPERFHAWMGDVLTRENPLSLVVTSNLIVDARFTPITFIWTNIFGGDWESVTNWMPNLAPGNDDIVFLARPVTVTLDSAVECGEFTYGQDVFSTLTGNGSLTVSKSLVWNAGTMSMSGPLTVLEDFAWTGGTMSGGGRTIVAPGAKLVLDHSFPLVVSGRTLENGGTLVWRGSGDVHLNSGAVITNRPGALFEVQSSGQFVPLSTANQIDNAGNFRKSASGAMTLPNALPFNNQGTVEIQAGVLSLAGGGAHTGTFEVPTGTTLSLAGTHNASSGSSFIGGGALTVSGGTANLSGLVNVGGTNTFSGGTINLAGNYISADNTVIVSGGVVNLTGDYLCTGSTLVLSGGTANFSGPGTASLAILNFSSGTLGGNSILTVENTMSWTGGMMSGSGRTVLAPEATLDAAIPSSAILRERTLENGGTVVFTGAGVLTIDSGGVIANRPGALFRIENLQTTGLGGAFASGQFDNAGTLRKSGGAGTTIIPSGLVLGNSGTVETHSGTLICNSSFSNSGAVDLFPGTTNRFVGGGTGDGTFSVAASAVVEWTGGTFALHSGAQLDGDGLYRFNGGNLTSAADLTVANLDLLSGFSTLSGTGTLKIGASMNWTAGIMSGTGRTIIEPGATLHLAISNAVGLHNSYTLENGGTVLWSGPGIIQIISAIITNRPGALFEAQSNARFEASGINRFDNAGIFRKSAGAGTTTVRSGMTFHNYGMVDLRSGILAANGGYTSTSNALLHCALGGTIPGTNYGQLQVAGPVTLDGAFSVDFTDGFSTALNDSFTVLTAGTRNGTFADFLYPSNTVTMQLSTTANSVIVHVTDVLTAIPQPMLLPPEILGSDFKLTWTAVSNTVYRVEFNPDLAPSNWTALPGDVIGVSNTASKLDPLTPSNRLYRVRLLP
jgi:archaellum component FlaF (FlaF/FlaG flagellin family)